ncbi:MAG: hypothetical protein LBV08_11130 [Clostridiales bacterium]|nr:hypothetical protein [Clostridiales bacterium]
MGLENIIKSLAARKIISYFILAIIFGVMVFTFFSGISYFFTKPKEVESFSGLMEAYENGNVYVRLKGMAIYDTGVDRVTGIGLEEKHYSTYFVALADDGAIPIELPPEYLEKSFNELSDVTITGVAEKMAEDVSGTLSYMSQTIDSYYKGLGIPNEKGFSPSIKINAVKGLGFYEIFVAGVAVLGFLISATVLILQIIIYFNYKLSKGYKQLEKYGPIADVLLLADNELVSKDVYSTYISGKGIIITNTFFISVFDNMAVKRLSELKMAYAQINKSPLPFKHKRCYLCLFFAGQKGEYKIRMANEEMCQNVLYFILGKLGAAIVGYDNEYVEMFKKGQYEFDSYISKFRYGGIGSFEKGITLNIKEG